MRLRVLELCEYAGISQEGSLTIAGVFDGGKLPPVPPQPAGEGPRVLMLPKFYLVFVLTASLSEGTEHRLTLKIEDEDGQPVIDPVDIPIHFNANRQGRQMRFNGVANFPGLPLRGGGDYEIKLFQGTIELGSVPLYIDASPAP